MTTRDSFHGKSVLLTGGTGSFGRALSEELLRREVGVLRVFDHDENGLWSLQEDHRGEQRLRYLLGDVRDLDRLRMACDGVDLVIHAAALKHVYSCEYNPFEAVKTNVLGTQDVIEAALADTPAVLFDPSGLEEVVPVVALGGAVGARSPEELRALAQSILSGSPKALELTRRRGAFIEQVAFGGGGGASSRLVELIDRLQSSAG